MMIGEQLQRPHTTATDGRPQPPLNYSALRSTHNVSVEFHSKNVNAAVAPRSRRVPRDPRLPLVAPDISEDCIKEAQDRARLHSDILEQNRQAFCKQKSEETSIFLEERKHLHNLLSETHKPITERDMDQTKRIGTAPRLDGPYRNLRLTMRKGGHAQSAPTLPSVLSPTTRATTPGTSHLEHTRALDPARNLEYDIGSTAHYSPHNIRSILLDKEKNPAQRLSSVDPTFNLHTLGIIDKEQQTRHSGHSGRLSARFSPQSRGDLLSRGSDRSRDNSRPTSKAHSMPDSPGSSLASSRSNSAYGSRLGSPEYTMRPRRQNRLASAADIREMDAVNAMVHLFNQAKVNDDASVTDSVASRGSVNGKGQRRGSVRSAGSFLSQGRRSVNRGKSTLYGDNPFWVISNHQKSINNKMKTAKSETVKLNRALAEAHAEHEFVSVMNDETLNISTAKGKRWHKALVNQQKSKNRTREAQHERQQYLWDCDKEAAEIRVTLALFEANKLSNLQQDGRGVY